MGQLVAFEGRGAMEVGVAGTGLTEQVLGNEAAQIHRLLILTEPLHPWPLGSSKNAIFPEFLFHRQWLFGCKVTPIL